MAARAVKHSLACGSNGQFAPTPARFPERGLTAPVNSWCAEPLHDADPVEKLPAPSRRSRQSQRPVQSLTILDAPESTESHHVAVSSPGNPDNRLLSLGAFSGCATPMKPDGNSANLAQPKAIAVYKGQYVCNQGLTGVVLSVMSPPSGQPLKVVFAFAPVPQNPTVPRGEYVMAGRFDPAGNGFVDLRQVHWLNRPVGCVMVDLRGRTSPDDQQVQGTVGWPRLHQLRGPPRPIKERCFKITTGEA